LFNDIKRYFLFSAGCLSLFLGIIGIFLPLLPTTPFVLLAVTCLAKSSPKLHRWIITHPYFGPIIVNWNEHRCLTKQVKIKATFFIVISFSLSILFVNKAMASVFLLAMMLCLLVFIWSRKVCK
jgi:uncharacterized membrane protein YbaN (DUF454 family)